MPSVSDLQKIATQVRRDIIRMTNNAASGHPGGSLGCADFITVLYFYFMKPDPGKFSMDGKGEALFFLSNGHISPAWYSVLARYGFFSIKELGTFRKINSRLQGHPTPFDGLPGIRIASGSLGQGLSVAIGSSLAKKLNHDPELIYCLTGDGELQEGQNWEAMMFAAANHVDNLVAVVDYNGKQIDGSTDKVLNLGNLKAKIESFGWNVLEMNGNDIPEMIDILAKAKSETGQGKPIMILMHTHMGFGVDFMLDNHEWHGVPPSDAQAAIALAQLEETLGDF
jgi:transketolase